MRFFKYLTGLLQRRRVEREAEAEIRFHLEMEAEANGARGLPPDDARRTALRDFGGVTQAREAVRRVRTTWIDGAWQDLRYSVRTLRRSPAFALVAIVVLALGVGVNIGAFSVVNAALFPKYEVSQPDELVYFFRVGRYGRRQITTTDDFRYLESQQPAVFSDFTAHWGRNFRVSADDETTVVFGETVLANYLHVLGVKPAIGQGFRPIDDDPSNVDLAVLISHELWVDRFDSDPNIIGKKIRVENRSPAITGVMPPGFTGLSSPWRPAKLWITAAAAHGALKFGMGLIGRMSDGVGIDQARSAIAVVSARIEEDRRRRWPADRPYEPMPYVAERIADVLMPFDPNATPISPKLVAAVLSVVAIVLVIATTNIAGVLAARGLTRAGEVAVRQALGAGGMRLVRQLVVESTVLALAGGVVGLAVARILLGLYTAYTPERFVVDVAFNLRVVLFMLAVCLVAGVMVGIAPALQSLRVNVLSALGSGAAAGTSSRSRRRLRHSILIPQIGLSIALLVMAGVHGRALAKTETTDLGYRIDGITVLRIGRWDSESIARPEPGENFADLQARRAERDRAFYRAVAGALRAVSVPGGVALATSLPTYSYEEPATFLSQDRFIAGNRDELPAWQNEVSSGYFSTMGIALRRGRDFDDRDTRNVPGVAIVSESLANRFWPAGDAIGKSIALFPPYPGKPPEWREVIGVVAETRPIMQEKGDRPVVYTSLAQSWQPSFFSAVAAGHGESAGMVRELKRAATSADTFAEVAAVRTMNEIAGELLYPRRAAASILLACGVLGLLLATIGLYGVMSHSVAQRLKEIGIRSTLGAGRRDILKLVLKEAAGVALLGAVPGLVIGVIALRVTTNLVGELPTFDALTFVAVPLMATVVVLAAAFIPARHASRLDPMAILRTP